MRHPRALPGGVHRIEIAVPYLGTVNVWLLEGDPLTLVDTGPGNAASLEALEAALESARALGRGGRAGPAHAPPPRSLRPRRCDRDGLGGPDRRDGGHGCVGIELPRAGRARSGVRTPPARRARRPGGRDRVERAVLGAHHPEQRELRDDRRPPRRRRRPGRRPRLPRRRAPGPQRHRHALRERRGRRRNRRRPPPPGDHLGCRGGSARAVGEHPAAGARAVPRRAPPHRGDGARPAAPGPRPRDPRPSPADRRANRVPRTAARARRRLDRRRAAARRSRSRSASGTTRPRRRRPSS